MTTVVTCTTELEAVNTLLAVIGESPINTLASPGFVDAVNAKSVLSEVSRAVQTTGWHFNTEINFELSPDLLTKEVLLPANCIRVDTVYPDQSTDAVARGTRFYDRNKHTYQFDKSVTVDMVVCLQFEELPQAARHYITVRAARVYQARELGSDTLFRFTARDEELALADLKRAEGVTGNYNWLSGINSFSNTLRRF